MKKINKNLLRQCMSFEFPIDYYNYYLYEEELDDKYKEINVKDFINFLKREKINRIYPYEQIYSQTEHEPKRIDGGMINGVSYEIWTNGCFPWVKITTNFYKDQFIEFATLVKMPKTRGLVGTRKKRKLECKYPDYIWNYNALEDFYGGGHSYGYDPSYHHNINEIFADICDFVYQVLCAKVDLDTQKMYIKKENE